MQRVSTYDNWKETHVESYYVVCPGLQFNINIEKRLSQTEFCVWDVQIICKRSIYIRDTRLHFIALVICFVRIDTYCYRCIILNIYLSKPNESVIFNFADKYMSCQFVKNCVICLRKATVKTLRYFGYTCALVHKQYY